jgi:hypothetical protein
LRIWLRKTSWTFCGFSAAIVGPFFFVVLAFLFFLSGSAEKTGGE